MMTLTSEYALRAMIYFAQTKRAWPLSGTQIAAKTGVSRKYLSKILGDLVRADVLEESPGKGGGYRLSRSPKHIRHYQLVAPFEPVCCNRRPYPFGNEVCDDDRPCLGHERWVRVRNAYAPFLNETSVHDIAIRNREHDRNGTRSEED